MTVAITRLDHTAEQLRAEAGRCKEADMTRRLLAIAHVMTACHAVVPRNFAAWSGKRCATGCIATMPWVWQAAQPAPCWWSAAKLTEAQQAEFAGWVEAGPNRDEDKVVRWRQRDLQQKLRARFRHRHA